MKKLVVSVVSAMIAAATAVPVKAASPIPIRDFSVVGNDGVQPVQYRGDSRGRYYRGGNRYERPGYYRGHRGYRYSRPGYRRGDDGWWYPLAAFGAGAIIGGAIAQPPVRYVPRVRNGSAHVEWCTSRYRTYRPYDNTYVPRVGVRAQCISPYS
jgi:hypothetical protein